MLVEILLAHPVGAMDAMTTAMAQSVFESFDKDNSKKISAGELSGAVEKLGLVAKQSELEEMINNDDTNGDGGAPRRAAP